MRARPRNVLSGSPLGGGAVPVIVVCAALGVAVAFFFLYTKGKLKPAGGDKGKGEVVAVPVAAGGVEKVAVVPVPEMKVPSAGSALPGAVEPKKPSATGVLGFARPQDLASHLVRVLAEGDYKQAAKMAGNGDAAEEAETEALLEGLFKGKGFKIGPEDKIQMLGQSGPAIRMGLPLIAGDGGAGGQLQIDSERHQPMGWKITQFYLPKELAAVAGMSGQGGGGAAGAGAAVVAGMKSKLFTVVESPDALSAASGFVSALLKQDFAAARKWIDEKKVSPQKLAGLCIVFEEGKYELKQNKPLIMTTASPNNAWVIAQVESEPLQQQTEFGVEMVRGGGDKPWVITGLNLSDLLGSYAKGATKLGVPYTPIVTNPRGGESLALYFEYDESGLHPRAKKQLEIVAGLLKSDAAKKLRITGHTDAMGTDGYNKGLSSNRAASVKLELVALGVPEEQIITEGLGKAAPISPNQKADGTDDPEGRSRNRRAEIFLDF